MPVRYSLPLLFLALFWSGCATPPTGPSSSSTGQEGIAQSFHDAEVVNGATPGRHAAQGQGQSMGPIYDSSTVLVFNPIKYEELVPGMNVAYVNSEGRRVVHQLLEKTPNGWTVLGLNNSRIDTDLVTSKNLLGVVYVKIDSAVDAITAPTVPAASGAATR